MPMTELQKAQNKAAQRVKEQAHKLRRREIDAAVDAAENDPEVLAAVVAAEQASAALTAAVEDRDRKVDALLEQIAALQSQIDTLKGDPEIDRLRSEARTMNDSLYRLKRQKVQAAESAFPDMQGHARFYASGWKPPAEVLQAMEQARQQAVVADPEPAGDDDDGSTSKAGRSLQRG